MANSQVPTLVFNSGFVQIHVRLDRLPQPEAGMVAFWHVCWVNWSVLLFHRTVLIYGKLQEGMK